MTTSVKRLILIFLFAIAFMATACDTPGDAALRAYETPEVHWTLRRQP